MAFVLAFGNVPMEANAEEIKEDELQQALYLIPEGYPNIDFLAPGTEYTVPETVTADEAKARVLDLAEKFEGKFFTVSGNYCTASGIHAAACSNCLMSNVIAAEWVEELVGMGTLDASLCPTQYSYKGTQGSADGYQCFGFANFAHWYVFAGKNTDKVTSTLELTGPMTYETMIKALPGDVIRSNYYGGHSMIFISCDEEGFNVIDSNHTGNADGKSACIVKVHKVKYNAKYTVAVTGTTNYDRESATEYFLVKYNANGGTGAPASQIKTEDVNLVLASDIPTFEGREFLGWARTADAAVPEFAPGAEYSENADITLYAVWSECRHSYKNGTCTICGSEHPNLINYKGKVISILSASTSTFAGYIPIDDGFNLEHRTRYPQDNLLTDVNETWWMQVINELGAKLGINESWAGSQVLNTQDNNSGDLGPDAAMASVTRIKNVGANGTPDVIFFFGAGNDMGRGVAPGSFDPATAPTEVDLVTKKWDNLADAYVAAIMRLQYFYPDAEIVVMTTYAMPSYVTEAKLNKYAPVLNAICDHYGVKYVDLRNSGVTFDMLPDNIHPNAEGMDHITEAVLDFVLNEYEAEPGENVVYSVTHELTGAKAEKHYYKGVSAGRAFEEAISGENLSVKVTMGGKDITAETYKDGKISISSVSGDIVITATGKYNCDGHLQELPEELCAGTNLWTALEPENIYYTASGWGNLAGGTSWSITFPVNEGERIFATSFGAYPGNGSTANGTRITWFSETGVLESVARDVVYKEFAANGYITVPKGAVAVNIPHSSNNSEFEVYLLDREHDFVNKVCSICRKEQINEALAGHLQELPEEICAGTNLWTALEPENIYYLGTKWGLYENDPDVHSITFPVNEGERIFATSFGAYPGNGSTANGTRITWFSETGVLESVARDVVYKEFVANGFITVPEGAMAVNIPYRSPEGGKVYLLDREHDFENGICTVCGEWEHPMGDINLDGSVNVKDAYYARLVAAKLIRPTEQQILLGDVDLDGRITALDANIIRKFAVKIITEIAVKK